MTHAVGVALAQARALGVERLDAQLIVAHHLQRPRSWLIAHDDAPLEAEQAASIEADLRQRADGVPLAYLTGEREFHGLRLEITSDVLVPRPDTETLVDWAIEYAAAFEQPSIADLGTGSGAIALALARALPRATITATDVSAAALALAGRNAQRLGLALELAAGDWLAALRDRRFDLIVSNPPYIAADDPHLPALRHEPTLALTPGGDGLDAIRRIVANAPQHLQPGGWLLLEHGWDQAAATGALLRQAGFTGVSTRHDLARQPRCSGGQWPGPADSRI